MPNQEKSAYLFVCSDGVEVKEEHEAIDVTIEIIVDHGDYLPGLV